MRQEAKNQSITSGKRSAIEKLENLHPYQTLMYLGIGASALVFMFMAIAFSVRVWSAPDTFSIELPKFFTISTFIMVFSGFGLKFIRQYYREENSDKLVGRLSLLLVLGVAFAISQLLGWLSLYNQEQSFQEDLSVAYLYVISGLHMLHLIGGLIFLIYLNVITFNIRRDSVKELIYFTDKFKQLQLELLISYWRFLDISWLVLFFWFFFIF
jgi:cytochrome c oxidase subunit 3